VTTEQFIDSVQSVAKAQTVTVTFDNDLVIIACVYEVEGYNKPVETEYRAPLPWFHSMLMDETLSLPVAYQVGRESRRAKNSFLTRLNQS
jgi:hypothetical protein